MIPALCRLALFPGVTIIPVVSMRQSMTSAVREGRPTDYLPRLTANDVVYAAGAPAMVEAVTRIAGRTGAQCFSDPFAPSLSPHRTPGFLSRAANWFTLELPKSPSISMADYSFQPRHREEPVSGI
jgi:3-phenylpropionate/trans-cinnamate dioxygenase ferredoxin reductase subunit